MAKHPCHSVTRRTTDITQPRGGYLNPNLFTVYNVLTDYKLRPTENIHPALLGSVVDYLTRIMLGIAPKDAFALSLMGAAVFDETYPDSSSFKTESAVKQIQILIQDVQTLCPKSVVAACKIAGYDVCARASIAGYKPVETINPDNNTIQNIMTLVNRSVAFWSHSKNEPVTAAGLDFNNAYTREISSGMCGYLTEHTLWDMRVIRTELNNKHTLRLLINYLMGVQSSHPEFDSIQNLGIYNPRLSKAYFLPIKNIPLETIKEVADKVIGYGPAWAPYFISKK